MKNVVDLPRRVPALLAVVALALLMSSCATQPALPMPEGPGFLLGLLHGFLIAFGFIGSLFTDYRIYAFPNAGAWYDFGYLLGAMVFLSGSGAGGRPRRHTS